MKEKILIDDYKNTIARLQQECTEKTDNIIALGEQLARKTEECEKLKQDFFEMQDNFACEMQARLYHQNQWLKMSEELQAEKQKVAELEAEIANMRTLSIMIDNNKYKQALEEIRVMLETIMETNKNVPLQNNLAKILQKCEVLNDNT